MASASTAQACVLGTSKGRASINAQKLWEVRQRGEGLPLQVMLRLKSRYLVDGAAIGSAEFLRRLTGKSEGAGRSRWTLWKTQCKQAAGMVWPCGLVSGEDCGCCATFGLGWLVREMCWKNSGCGTDLRRPQGLI